MFLESLFHVFEASWGALGVSRGSLGGLLKSLGAILGRLGAKLGGLGTTFGALRFFGAILGAKRAPKGRHLGSQNRAKIDQKKRCKFKSEKVTSWSRLGVILGRFPRRLEVKNIDSSFLCKAFRENPHF